MTRNTPNILASTAESLMKQNGYHGFSYADIADCVGIRKASIHHHFKTKQELAEHVVTEYGQGFASELARIEQESLSPVGRLEQVGQLFLHAFRGEGGMCLCAALTGDWHKLPDAVREPVARFWHDTRAWLSEALFIEPDLVSARRRAAIANAVLALLEGGLLCSRVDQDEQALKDAIEAAAMLLRSETLNP